jgi:UDP-galactopyranose mutase
MKVLIVGAGFAGAVYARGLAEAGHVVEVIDKRPHVGGNAYDFVDDNGVRVHAYGPHLFHTKMPHVADWVRRFGVFVPYVHRVRAKLPDGRLAPLPINLDTVNAVFGTAYQTADEVAAQLARVALPIAAPANAAEHLYSRIGRELTDLFFRPYTRKMWDLELEDLAAAVVRRLPLRLNRDDNYFADGELQMLPRDGYTALFAAMFDHGLITVRLNRVFEKAMLPAYDFCFNAMPIDEFFECCLGELPYRSIRFHARTVPDGPAPETAMVNFTDAGRFTRETTWDALPNHRVISTGRRTITAEEPCDYRDNHLERYYPVQTADGRYAALYERYRALAAEMKRLRFIGRCGTYRYLDMDQVINQSLAGVAAFLAGAGA